MFKPPDWEWSQFGDVGWWSRDGWGDVLLGATTACALTNGGSRAGLTTIKSGPHRVVYRVDLPAGHDLRQAFSGAGLASNASAVGSPGQGSK